MVVFARYTALSVLGTLGISCYILADTFFVSQGLGLNGLAALNIAIPVYNFIHGCGLMLGMGGATCFTLRHSRGEKRRARSMFTHTALLAAGIALMFTTAGMCCPARLAAMLGADGETLAMSTTYLRWLMIFAPAFIMNDVLLCFARNDHAPKRAMFAMLAGSFANIAMDYVFIFPLHMGILGAVLATCMAPLISMSILAPHCLSQRCGFHPVRTRLKGRSLGGILSLGIPALLSQVSGGVVMIVFNHIMLKLEGNTGVAAYGVVANLALVVTGVYTGMADGVQPLLSECCGRGEREQLRTLLKYALFTAGVASCLIYAALALGAQPVAAAFNSEDNEFLQKMAEEGIRLYFTSGFFAGMNILLSAFYAAVEQPVPAQILSLLRGLILIVPLALLLSALWGVRGLWITLTVVEAAVLVLALLLLPRSPALKK